MPLTQHAADESPAYAEGDLIARRYKVFRRDSGGIGDVYFCRDQRSGLALAIKTIQSAHLAKPDKHRSLTRRLGAEAAILVGIEEHPNLVRCHYLAQDGDRLLLCMEWIADPQRRDVGLGRMIRKRGKLPAIEALGIGVGVCRGLLHLQDSYAGFVHRDLKPENILMAQDGTPKITDFGFSLLRGEARGAAGPAISDSSIVGTPHYMAPEQFRTGLVDERADVYALGLILYEMIEGRRAFDAKDRAGWRHAHRHEPPRAFAEDAPEALKALGMECIQKDPEARPQSIAALLGRLIELYDAIAGEPPPEAPGPRALTAERHNNRGNTYYHLGRFEDAMACYAAASEADPGLWQPRAGAALALHGLGRPDEALAAYDAAIQEAPGRAWTHANRAVLLQSLGRTEEAMSGFDAALNLDSTLAEAAHNRGLLRLACGDRTAALEDFDAAIAAGGLRDAYVARAHLRAEAGAFAGAVADIESAGARSPLSLEELQSEAEWLVELGRYREAVAAYTRALAKGGPPVQLHRARAGAYARAGRLRDALEDLSTALKLEPLETETLLQRAAVYRDLGLSEEAMADYSRAIAIDEDDPRAYYGAGLLLGYRGETDAARSFLSAAAERGSGEASRAIRSLEARLRAVKALANPARRPQ